MEKPKKSKAKSAGLRLPKYALHKADGQAVCFVKRRTVYLGKYGSPESKRKYGEIVAALVADAKPESAAIPQNRPTPASIGELCLLFAEQRLPTYSADEQRCQGLVIRILVDLYGEAPAGAFNPLNLRAVRQVMVERGWSRSFINKQTSRVKHIFSWAVGWNLGPVTVADALKHVESLASGQTIAPDTRPRAAVPEERLNAVRTQLSGRSRDLFELMLLTGCRPGELLNLTMAMIDRSGDVWRADLAKHKTAHRGKSRTLFFNASAQEILQRYFRADPNARLFAVRVDTFAAAVRSACERAFSMPHELRKPQKGLTSEQKADVKRRAIAWRRANCFSPHWLRHTVATQLADELGLEAAQRLLGHSTAAMTAHYSKSAERKAVEAAKRLG